MQNDAFDQSIRTDWSTIETPRMKGSRWTLRRWTRTSATTGAILPCFFYWFYDDFLTIFWFSDDDVWLLFWLTLVSISTRSRLKAADRASKKAQAYREILVWNISNMKFLIRSFSNTENCLSIDLNDECFRGEGGRENGRAAGAVRAGPTDRRGQRRVKMMNCVSKTRNSVSKTRNSVSKMMNFAGLNAPAAKVNSSFKLKTIMNSV